MHSTYVCMYAIYSLIDVLSEQIRREESMMMTILLDVVSQYNAITLILQCINAHIAQH